MRGLKARTNFMYPAHETCLLSAAAALAAPNNVGVHHASSQQVELIAQKTLGEVLLLSSSKKPPRNFDWLTTQLSSHDEPAAASRDVFGNRADGSTHKQMGDECRLPGHGCRYVDRKILAERASNVLDILHHDVKTHAPTTSLPVSPGLMNKAEPAEASFGVSPGRREQWHSDEDQQFRLNHFESRSPIVNSELFVSRYCAGTGSQPFQVCFCYHLPHTGKRPTHRVLTNAMFLLLNFGTHLALAVMANYSPNLLCGRSLEVATS